MTQTDQRRVSQTLAIRSQADELLKRLLTERHQAQQRQPESIRRDGIGSMTGRVAIDKAIAETRSLIRSMDDLLSQIRGEVRGLSAPSHRRRESRLQRAAAT